MFVWGGVLRSAVRMATGRSERSPLVNYEPEDKISIVSCAGVQRKVIGFLSVCNCSDFCYGAVAAGTVYTCWKPLRVS